jgi:hypothetical protein
LQSNIFVVSPLQRLQSTTTTSSSSNIPTSFNPKADGPLSSYVNPSEALLDTSLLKQGKSAGLFN